MPEALGGGTHRDWTNIVPALRERGIDVLSYWNYEGGEALGVEGHCALHVRLRRPGRSKSQLARRARCVRQHRNSTVSLNMRRIVVLLAASAILCGCVNTIAGVVGESVGVPMGDRIISSKVEPNVLLAADGASCTVSKNRWEKAEVGHRFFCAWSKV